MKRIKVFIVGCEADKSSAATLKAIEEFDKCCEVIIITKDEKLPEQHFHNVAFDVRFLVGIESSKILVLNPVFTEPLYLTKGKNKRKNKWQSPYKYHR